MTLMKLSPFSYYVIFLVFIVDIAHPLETRQGTIRRTQSIVCTNNCGDFYLEPDPGNDFIYLKGNISSYVGQHVEVTGFRASCGGCASFIVIEVEVLIVSGVDTYSGENPESFSLVQNFPNPFNPTTVIEFTLPLEGVVRLTVFNVLGQEVETLVDGKLRAGSYEVSWNPTGQPSGVYFFRLSFAGVNGTRYVQTRKMLYL